MLTPLLRRSGLAAGLVMVLLLLGAVYPALATHLLGGEMTYRYLDANGPGGAPLRYELTITVYNNCGATTIVQPKTQALAAIYDQATGRKLVLTGTNSPYFTARGELSIPKTSLSDCIAPPVPPGCTITGVSQPYRLEKFIAIVNLPYTSTGYYAVFSDKARNVDITNLFDPGSQAMTLYVSMLPPTIPNSSPVFSDVAVAIICANDTTFLLNNAVDADGDRLVYTFGQPYAMQSDNFGPSFTPPPMQAAYNAGAGYSAATPFGTAPGNFTHLDPATGLASYGATGVGRKYVVAVDVQEYRTIGGQEQLIGTTRRDLQLVVALCPPARAPAAPPAITARDYVVEAGKSIGIPITATQADNHPLELTLNSELLDGPGGHNATFGGDPGTRLPGSPTGTATVASPTGAVGSTLFFAATCADVRATPYDVAFTIKDKGCAGKTTYDVLHITVVPPAGLPLAAVALATPPTQCAGTALTFSPVPANLGPAPGYQWFVNNTPVASTPTFTSSALADGDQVRVVLAPTVGFCASGPAQATVTVRRTPVPPPALTIVSQTTQPVCTGAPLTFSLAAVANPGPTPTYQWQVDGVDVAGAQAPVFTSTTLRDGQLVALRLRTTTVCEPITVTSNKLRATLGAPVDVEAGPDKEIIAGEQTTLDGTASGTYPVTWTPSLGLTFLTGDQLHPSAAPLVTTTYTLSAGAGTCADNSLVTVTVRPRLRIPSAISPNGDGENDTWQIENIGEYAANHVLVFNRWGNKIFETSGYSRSNEWNGSWRGQPAPVGTYYYVITLGNGHSYSGPLTVVY